MSSCVFCPIYKAAFILGPRAGRFTKDGKVVPIVGHSLPLVSLGGFILIMGFMAFNGGSQGAISSSGDGEAVGRAILSTLVACGTGGSTVLVLYKFVVGGHWSLSQIINGCLAGLCTYNETQMKMFVSVSIITHDHES